MPFSIACFFSLDNLFHCFLAGEGFCFVEVKGDCERSIGASSAQFSMATVSVVSTSGIRANNGNTTAVDKLPEEMNDMKIRDDKVRWCSPVLMGYPIGNLLFPLII